MTIDGVKMPKTNQPLLDEIEKLKRENNILKELNVCVGCETDYKARIDKAINKMQDIRDLGFDYDGFNNVKDLKGLIDVLVDLAGQSIDILRGEDK